MNRETLQQLLQTRPALDRLLDSILTAGADEGRTTVDDLLADGEIPRKQAIILLRELESHGYGTFKVGRKGHPSRFEWIVDPEEHRKLLDDEADERVPPEPAPTPLELPSTPVFSAAEVQHQYVLRPDYRVSLSLPENLTPREAEVLGDWVRNLSFER
jgi:hypothetical protein